MKTMTMTSSRTSSSGLIGRTLGGISRYLAGRRALATLSRADDRMLRDIGLSRTDLEQFRRMW